MGLGCFLWPFKQGLGTNLRNTPLDIGVKVVLVSLVSQLQRTNRPHHTLTTYQVTSVDVVLKRQIAHQIVHRLVQSRCVFSIEDY